MEPRSEPRSEPKKPPAHTDTPLGARSRPDERDIQRVVNVYASGNFKTPYERLLVRIDNAVQGGVGKVKDDKILILAKIVEELKVKLTSPGDDECGFIEEAERYLKTPDCCSVKGLFFRERVLEAVSEVAMDNPTGQESQTSSGRSLDPQMAPTANIESSQIQPRHRPTSRLGEHSRASLLPDGAHSTGRLLGPLNRTSLAQHVHDPRLRRLSDSAAMPNSQCPNCGQHWLAHLPGGARALVLARLGLAITPEELTRQAVGPLRESFKVARPGSTGDLPDVLVKVNVAQEDGSVEVQVARDVKVHHEVNVVHHHPLEHRIVVVQPLGLWDHVCRVITVGCVLGFALTWVLAILMGSKNSS